MFCISQQIQYNRSYLCTTWHILGSKQSVKTGYDIKGLIVSSEKLDGTEYN
jgi:hypothetical protein